MFYVKTATIRDHIMYWNVLQYLEINAFFTLLGDCGEYSREMNRNIGQVISATLILWAGFRMRNKPFAGYKIDKRSDAEKERSKQFQRKAGVVLIAIASLYLAWLIFKSVYILTH